MVLKVLDILLQKFENVYITYIEEVDAIDSFKVELKNWKLESYPCRLCTYNIRFIKIYFYFITYVFQEIILIVNMNGTK